MHAPVGVDPNVCLPVCLDVGTNNKALLVHPAYRGVRSPRPSHAEYHAFVHEFMSALKQWRPHVLLQFEDFANHSELSSRGVGSMRCCLIAHGLVDASNGRYGYN